MTTTEHLQLTKAECERLLAIAEKRTQGEWFTDDNLDPALIAPEDAAYIAACAGRAEAGWRATIAAIDFLSRPQSSFGHSRSELAMIEPILAAWPIELLTNKPQ
jgi:hypothetical protein